MKRQEHTFQFSGKQISEAATAECQYHTQRLDFWNKEYEIAVAKVKEKGVEVREYAVTGGMRTQIVLDPTLQSRMDECRSKIFDHRKAADDFQIQAAAYGTQSERAYELHPDDVIYFRLAGGARAE